MKHANSVKNHIGLINKENAHYKIQIVKSRVKINVWDAEPTSILRKAYATGSLPSVPFLKKWGEGVIAVSVAIDSLIIGVIQDINQLHAKNTFLAQMTANNAMIDTI